MVTFYHFSSPRFAGLGGWEQPSSADLLTQTGYEFWPDALEACLHYAAARVTVPIYITESGVATGDDNRRTDSDWSPWIAPRSAALLSRAGGTCERFRGRIA